MGHGPAEWAAPPPNAANKLIGPSDMMGSGISRARSRSALVVERDFSISATSAPTYLNTGSSAARLRSASPSVGNLHASQRTAGTPRICLRNVGRVADSIPSSTIVSDVDADVTNSTWAWFARRGHSILGHDRLFLVMSVWRHFMGWVYASYGWSSGGAFWAARRASCSAMASAASRTIVNFTRSPAIHARIAASSVA
jgi:hypothetical protein